MPDNDEFTVGERQRFFAICLIRVRISSSRSMAAAENRKMISTIATCVVSEENEME